LHTEAALFVSWKHGRLIFSNFPPLVPSLPLPRLYASTVLRFLLVARRSPFFLQRIPPVSSPILGGPFLGSVFPPCPPLISFFLHVPSCPIHPVLCLRQDFTFFGVSLFFPSFSPWCLQDFDSPDRFLMAYSLLDHTFFHINQVAGSAINGFLALPPE